MWSLMFLEKHYTFISRVFTAVKISDLVNESTSENRIRNIDFSPPSRTPKTRI